MRESVSPINMQFCPTFWINIHTLCRGCLVLLYMYLPFSPATVRSIDQGECYPINAISDPWSWRVIPRAWTRSAAPFLCPGLLKCYTCISSHDLSMITSGNVCILSFYNVMILASRYLPLYTSACQHHDVSFLYLISEIYAGAKSYSYLFVSQTYWWATMYTHCMPFIVYPNRLT